MAEVDFMSVLHKSTQRDYLGRVNDQEYPKAKAAELAKKFDFDYWDGDRRICYGGYRYLEGRWEKVAQAMVEYYKLPNNAKILDIGCGKGYLLYEFLQLLPATTVAGFDRSRHALTHAKEEVKPFLSHHLAETAYSYDVDSFDLVVSITTLHNLPIFKLKKALQEIERVGRNKYIVVESYRNEQELFNLQCWALTCEAFFSTDEWVWLFDEFGYTGDYEFIFFE